MPVILYAGCMMTATAAFIFFSLASFSTVYNIPQCDFSIGAESFDPNFSHSFWLALATGMYLVWFCIFYSSNTNSMRLQITNCAKFTGFMCGVIGVVIIMLDCVMPGKMRETFSFEVDSNIDGGYPLEGYLNASFLERVSLEGVTVNGLSKDPQHPFSLTVSHSIFSHLYVKIYNHFPKSLYSCTMASYRQIKYLIVFTETLRN